MEEARVSKRMFAERIGLRLGVDTDRVIEGIDAAMDEIVQLARRDEELLLRGFGRFYPQVHKGHAVNYGEGRIDDYSVLKFSATRNLNRSLDKPAA